MLLVQPDPSGFPICVGGNSGGHTETGIASNFAISCGQILSSGEVVAACPLFLLRLRKLVRLAASVTVSKSRSVESAGWNILEFLREDRFATFMEIFGPR